MESTGNWNHGATLDGVPYRYQTLPKTKHSRAQFHLRTVASSTVYGELVIRRETKSDQLAKRSGLSTEVQTGDEVFDGNWYIESETPEFARAYLAAASRRSIVTSLGALGFHEMRVEASASYAGGLRKAGSVTITAVIYEPAENVETKLEFIRKAVAALRALCGNLPATSEAPRTRTDIAGRVALERALDIIPFLLAGVVVYAPDAGMRYALSQWSDAVPLAAMVAIPAAALYTGMAWFLLKGRSTSHKPLLNVLGAALLAFPVAAYGGLIYLNGHLDSSAPTVRKLPVLENWWNQGKKSRIYYATVHEWRPGQETVIREMRINGEAYRSLNAHSKDARKLQVSTRSGHYGLEWIEGVAVLPPEAVAPKAKAPKTRPAKVMVERPIAPQAKAPKARPAKVRVERPIAPAAPPAQNSIADPVDMLPKKASMGMVTEMIDRLPQSKTAKLLGVVGSEIFAEVHGDDLRIQVRNFSVFLLGTAGAADEYTAVGVSLNRNSGSNSPWTVCLLNDASHGQLAEAAPFVLMNPAFVIPGGAHCSDGTCELQLVVAVKPESGADFLEYSAADRMPINSTSMIPAAAAPLKPCG